MSALSRSLPLSLILIAASACGGSDQPPGPSATGFQLLDSAGVRVAVNGPETDSTSLGLVVELEIGVAAGNPEYELHQVGPIVVAPDGTIFAGDGGSRSIRAYSDEGTFIRSMGRAGEGPGEFRTITALWLVGDTLVAYDRTAHRATLFLLDGTPAGTWNLRRDDGSRLVLASIGTEGAWAFLERPGLRFRMEALQLFRDSVQVGPYDPSTGNFGPPTRRMLSHRRISGAEVYPADPLFEPPHLRVVGSDGTLYEAHESRYTIEAWDQQGRVVRRIVRELPPRRITPEDVEALRPATTGGELSNAIERAANYPPAEEFSMLGALLVAPDGSLLVQRLDDADPIVLERSAWFGANSRGETLSRLQPALWELIDAEGRYRGSVRFPQGFLPRHFDGERVTGVREDDVGVHRIVRLRITGV